ncbi:VPS10 domain-containing receptor SorCS3 isoform X2 [Electrophorus electricus]|uniref:VPS10 domain-containing receptor SorCS3 isoform X2 n=1 Tax=Electrophorus electricus TaxID=8005 RepID=UPI0015D0934B|nr:VPS10 domain-containing receptor SorCS3 isoform X2 [Electrophorus electricus]
MRVTKLCSFPSYCTVVLLCALVPVRAEITCASCFTLTQIPLKAQAESFLHKHPDHQPSLSRFYRNSASGSLVTTTNNGHGEDRAQLYSEVHGDSVSQRNRQLSALTAGADCNSFCNDKGAKLNSFVFHKNLMLKRREKRSRRAVAEFSDSDKVDGLEKFQGASGPRSDFRRTVADGLRNSARQSETILVISTFALTGDSAHSQARVLWSGINSSVILILTKLFDFNLGTVTESSLWRSVDLGATYVKLNDRAITRTMLSYMYVCPTNKMKILILSDPDVESSILISSDEGATFQKFSINFYIMSFLFHPSQENWLLAYSDDHKLYSSTDFGRKALSGLDKEADLVHIEAQTDSGLIQYVTCRAQRCPDGSRQYPFSSQIDTNSLVVQDEYIFLQLTTAGRTTYFVSYQRGPFRHIQLPKYCLPKDMHIISTEDGQVLAAVQEWNENDTYSLYISDTTGVYFTRSLPHLRTSRGLAGNLIVDIYKVAGVNGILIANKKESKHMKTFITYNNGQTWNLLPAPPKDISGHGISCSLPSCSLHIHLQMSENPYTPDTILTKQSSPGLIVARGNVGDELSFAHSGMFISSDAGNTWRQIFEEEHSVWFLDNGGALMAITQASVPTQHLWISMDEGRQWNRISFSSTPLFVDGVLMEQDTQNYIITFFGHFSYLSDWQLVKIDYSGLFNGKCTDGDYQTWPLHYKGEVCVMGKRRVYMKRKPGTQCSLGKEYPRIISADPCICTLYDFECDYGFERQASGKCAPAFWHNAHTSVHTCSQGHSSLNSTGYRRVHSNNCKDGLMEVLSPKVQQCVTMPPRGLHLQTINKQLRANLGTNVTFRVTLQQGDSVSTSLHLDFGDGISVSYSNFSRLGDGIIHVYRTAGIFRVIAHAQNSQGSDTNSLYLHITSPLERISLSAPVVAIRGRQTNLTAIVWPSQPLTATFYWWLSNSTEPLITLGGSVSHTFLEEGRTLVMVQVSDSSTVLQDSQMVTVKDFFRSLLLSFSPNLEENNPSVAEWRQDVGRVVRATLSQVCGFPEEQLLVSVFPGSPTVAELFIFPETNHSQLRVAAEEKLDKMSEVFINALNQNLIYFDLKPDTRITVSVTQLTLAPLVDSTSLHSGSTMLMLLSLALVGLAVFFIYKFKRKIPWMQVQTEDTHEKEPDMINAVGQGDNSTHTPYRSHNTYIPFTTRLSTHSRLPSCSVTQSSNSQLAPPQVLAASQEVTTPKALALPREMMEREVQSHNGGGLGFGERFRTREIPNCTNV